jgi:tetratricopeptide (TPR) repeat protein
LGRYEIRSQIGAGGVVDQTDRQGRPRIYDFTSQNQLQSLSFAEFQKTLELDSNFPLPYQFLPAAYEQKVMYGEAIAAFKKAMPLKGGSEWPLSMAGLGHVYALSGKKAEARAVLDELNLISRQQYVPANCMALVYAGLSEQDQAFAWLEKAYEEHSFQMQWLKLEPRWDSLRSDPLFANLVRQIGLPQ